MRLKRLLPFLLLGAAFVLAACAPGGATREVTLHAKDLAFDMTTIEATQGQTVNVTYVNDGALEHNFVIEKFNVKETVKPRETLKFSFVASETGTFAYKCNIPGHTEAGMVGTLVVKP